MSISTQTEDVSFLYIDEIPIKMQARKHTRARAQTQVH